MRTVCTPRAASIKLRTIIGTSDPFTTIIQHADMIARHSKRACNNLTVHQRQLPAESINLYAQNQQGIQHFLGKMQNLKKIGL